jgi:two-component system nitrate/nitrite response regulator NarL
VTPDPPAAGLVVAILAENEMLRHGIEGLLRSVPEVAVTHSCAHRYELTKLLRGEPIDTVILTAPDVHWFCSSAHVIAPAMDTGSPVVPGELVQALLERSEGHNGRSRNRTLSLTDRERETLALVVRGLSNKEIARRLTISSNGVKRLVASIMLKLDAPNRTAAAVTAVRTGLVEAE